MISLVFLFRPSWIIWQRHHDIKTRKVPEEAVSAINVKQLELASVVLHVEFVLRPTAGMFRKKNFAHITSSLFVARP
jgi:hypothetical protein